MNLFRSISRIRPRLLQIAHARLQSAAAANGGDPIDFREVVARHSFAEHAARADKYFSTLDFASLVARKPFAAPAEAAELCAGLATLLPNLLLFSGARVLDFGAGTCWMTRLLALLGCDVTAVDVSRKALEVGERLIRSDALANQLKVSFVPLGGPELPFADGTFDRIVCFDALHHVPDQHEAIRQFARVLKDGGIAALHEPGPTHSHTSGAQFEMRMYDVIEADVHVEELIETARAAGFTSAELAVYANAITTDLGGFNDFLAGPAASSAGQRFIAHTAAGLENRRTFSCTSATHWPAWTADRHSDCSRASTCRRAWAKRTRTSKERFRTSVPNTWLPSFTGIGAVNIGVHLRGIDGQMINGDYARYALSTDRVKPGQARAVELDIPHPPGLDRFELVVDPVAEGIMWFEVLGGTPARFRVRAGDRPSVERIA